MGLRLRKNWKRIVGLLTRSSIALPLFPSLLSTDARSSSIVLYDGGRVPISSRAARSSPPPPCKIHHFKYKIHHF